MTVRDIDRGWSKYKRNMRLMKNSTTSVGVQRGSEVTGKEPFSELLTKAAVHEFGTHKAGKNRDITIPARSFLRSAADMNRSGIAKIQELAYSAVVDGRISTRKGLAIIGQFFEAKVKKRITDLKNPPLKNPSKKRTGPGGVANPLIDTGHLRQSIIHVEDIR